MVYLISLDSVLRFEYNVENTSLKVHGIRRLNKIRKSIR